MNEKPAEVVAPEDIYKNHAGTVLVSGKSEVGKVARYITHLIEKNVVPIDILFIGANAGQQACKACAVATIIAEKELQKKLAYITKRAKTKTEKQEVSGKVVIENGEHVLVVKDAFIWQLTYLP